MGKIKSKQIRRISKELMEKGIKFEEDFEKNKKTLGGEMPSKKMRNQLAGYLTKFKKKELIEKEKLNLKKD